MRAHKLISKNEVEVNMRPINVSLDATTWELAKRKSNFSQWVRDKLRSERNKKEMIDHSFCMSCWKKRPSSDGISCNLCGTHFIQEEE